MAIPDRSMAWKYRTLWIGIKEFSGFDNTGTADTSLSQGTPTLEPTSGTSEISCMPAETADEIHTVVAIPWDMNRDAQLFARVYYIHASTDADANIDWKIGVVPFKKTESVTELATIAAAGTAGKLVTVAVHTCSTNDDSLEVTPWVDTTLDTIIDADNDVLLGLVVECDDDGTATGNEPELIGIELLYEVQMCHPTSPHRSKAESVTSGESTPVHAGN